MIFLILIISFPWRKLPQNIPAHIKYSTVVKYPFIGIQTNRQTTQIFKLLFASYQKKIILYELYRIHFYEYWEQLGWLPYNILFSGQKSNISL